MDTQDKLKVLADASQYDLSCACSSSDSERRKRTDEGTWLYPTSLPRGGTSIMLKTLLSNVCTNNCRYCPFRTSTDPKRCTMDPNEVARSFLDYYRSRQVFGLFLSSGVIGSPDQTMERIVDTARILRRKHGFRGYLHLKVIPGASRAAIDATLAVASTVSLNVEVPTASAMQHLSSEKNFQRDIVEPLRYISEQTGKGSRYSRIKQSTQFIVGAAKESDREIVTATYGLYKRLKLNRVYFSAYQRGLGDENLPGEQATTRSEDILTREHRLYQVDWLIRKYGFHDHEIPYENGGNLSLDVDPKEHWARSHPERFPVNINRAGRSTLLRIPGLGPTTVRRILDLRKGGGRISQLDQIGPVGKRLKKAGAYLHFG